MSKANAHGGVNQLIILRWPKLWADALIQLPFEYTNPDVGIGYGLGFGIVSGDGRGQGHHPGYGYDYARRLGGNGYGQGTCHATGGGVSYETY